MLDRDEAPQDPSFNNLENLIRRVAAKDTTLGVTVGLRPYGLYFEVLRAEGATLADENVEDAMRHSPDSLPDRGSGLLNVFPMGGDFALFVIGTRDREWLLRALRRVAAVRTAMEAAA